MRKFLVSLAALLFVGSAAAVLRSCNKTCSDKFKNCTKYDSVFKCSNKFNVCQISCSQSFNINRAVLAMIDEQEINDSLKASFEEADINKDGFLNQTELIPVQGQSEE